MTQGGPIEPGLYDPADFVPRRKAPPAQPGDALLPAEDGFVATPRHEKPHANVAHERCTAA